MTDDRCFTDSILSNSDAVLLMIFLRDCIFDYLLSSSQFNIWSRAKHIGMISMIQYDLTET